MTLTPYIYFRQCQDGISCDCPILTNLKNNIPRISKHDWPDELIHFKRIFARPDATDDDWIAKKNPDSVGDFVLSNFCHDRRLPKLCQSDIDEEEKSCITLSEYDQFFQLLQTLYRRRNKSPDFAKYQLLEIVSFLKNKIVTNPTNSISFYAGHDLGIEAILVVLGIKMDHHVPYASRLVFEYWKTEENSEIKKIRILLNGEIVRIGASDFLKLTELDRLIDSEFENLFGLDFNWENVQKVCEITPE